MSSGATAVVLSGGGARGAYEAGVVAGMTEVLGCRPEDSAPFSIFTGTSVGAINATWLAAHADRGDMAVSGLLSHWEALDLNHYLDVDWLGLLIGYRGWRIGKERKHYGRSLLNPEALEALITQNIPFKRLRVNVEKSRVKALVVAALEISTARTALFAELSPGTKFKPSKDPRRTSVVSQIECAHVLASAAIPFIFPARRVDGLYYCDGGIRFNTPIAPAIRSGATRLVVVSGLRGREHVKPYSKEALRAQRSYPNPVFLLGKLLNALLLDPIHYDLHVLERFNRLIEILEFTLDSAEMERVQKVIEEARGARYRKLDTLVIRPSQDIGEIASEHVRKLKRRSLGALVLRLSSKLRKTVESDLASFILFDGDFTRELAELGRNDAKNKAAEILAFFE